MYTFNAVAIAYHKPYLNYVYYILIMVPYSGFVSSLYPSCGSMLSAKPYKGSCEPYTLLSCSFERMRTNAPPGS